MKIKATPTRKKLGQRIRRLRKKQSLSQEELGFKANLHRTYIGSIERGEQNVSVDNIHKLAKALKVSPKELMPSK
jgi:transcriptional regulator with XRE-family HTH domain